MTADGDAGRRHFPDLIPFHKTGDVVIDRIGGDEHRKRKPGFLQARPGFSENGQVGVIDGQAYGSVEKGLAVSKGGNDIGHRHYIILARFQFPEMGLELLNGDIGGGVFCLSEAVIHDDDGAIGAIAGGSCGGRRDGREESRHQNQKHGSKSSSKDHEFSHVVDVGLNFSRFPA